MLDNEDIEVLSLDALERTVDDLNEQLESAVGLDVEVRDAIEEAARQHAHRP